MRRVKRWLLSVVVGCALLVLRSAPASWVYVAPTVFLDQAEAVVAGTMTRVAPYEGAGVIAVTEVLKGDKTIKEVPVRFSAKPKPQPDGTIVMVSDTITFEEGQKGIWVLLPDAKDKAGAYSVERPLLYYDLASTARVKEMLAALAAQPWSEPVKGLAARLLVDRQTGARQTMVYLTVKNVGDTPLRVADYVGFRPISVVVVEPGGKERALDLYDWLAAARLRAPVAGDFPELAPGAIRYVGFPIGLGIGELSAPGIYEVHASYRNEADGSGLGIRGVWTGTVAAPPARVTVEQAEPRPEPP